MFKMGCTVAKKILAIDKGGGNTKDSGASVSGEVAKSGHNHHPTTSSDEINDFSKIKQDPRMPLNVRQMFKVTKSWKAIARTMSKTGTAMFYNLFEQNKHLFVLFDKFKHLNASDKNLYESQELRDHAATVMVSLDQSINLMSDYDNFVAYLKSIGKLHRKIPDFKREYFWQIEQPFLKAVKQTLDERYNESIEEIYQIAIKLIIATVADGYSEETDDNNTKKEARGDGPQLKKLDQKCPMSKACKK